MKSQILYKLLLTCWFIIISSLEGKAQLLNQFLTKNNKNQLLLNANIDSLKYIPNDLSSKSDPFSPLIVSFTYTGKYISNENDFGILTVGFNTDDLKHVSLIFLNVPFSFDAMGYLRKQYGMWSLCSYLKNDAYSISSPKTYSWNRGNYSVLLHTDSLMKKKIIGISPTD